MHDDDFFYRFRVALAVGLAFVVALLLLIRGAKAAEPCHTSAMSIAELDRRSKELHFKAFAWFWTAPLDATWTALYAHFQEYPDRIVIEYYTKGCRVPNPIGGLVRTSFDLTPDVFRQLDEADLVVENGGRWPLQTY